MRIKTSPSQRFVALTLLLPFGSIAGCKPYVSGLVQDASFTHESAAQARVGILGMAAPTDAAKLDAGEREMTATLQATRPNVFVGPSAVRQNLGEPSDRALREFGQSGALSPQRLAELKAKNPGFGYVIAGRLEEDHVAGSTAYEEAEVRVNGEKLETASADGQRLMKRTLKTERRILVKATIYDLRDGRLVWEAKRHEIAESSPVSMPIGSMDAVKLELAKMGKQISEQHPPAPDLDTMVAKALRAIAGNLPEPAAK